MACPAFPLPQLARRPNDSRSQSRRLRDVSDSCISQESNSGSSVVHPVAQRMCHLGTPGQVLAHRQNVCKISRQFGLSCPVNFVPRTSLPPDSLENIN
jgi:hypothetical protein